MGSGIPELEAALRDFALSSRGPDQLRSQAAKEAQAAGLLPRGAVHMWLEGTRREILLLDFEVHGDADTRHPPRVATLQGEALTALRAGDAVQGERLVRQALDLAPDAPDLWNNLGAAFDRQGRRREAQALVRDIHERYPDYLIGRANYARLLVDEGKLDAAETLVQSLLSRKRYHLSEFAAVMKAQIELLVARKDREAARSWLAMWAETEPDNPDVVAWQGRLGKPGVLPRLFGPRA
jgi:tetratricopeptide (TPR) repeat protein